MLKQYALYLKAGAVIALLGLLTWGAVSAYQWAYNNGRQSAELACAASKVALAEAAMADLQAARAKEQAIAAKLAGIDKQHQQDLADARTEQEAVANELRTGISRLRDHWQGCQATARVSGAAASAALADANARLREASTGRVVGAGKEADDWIKRLQDVVRADRSE